MASILSAVGGGKHRETNLISALPPIEEDRLSFNAPRSPPPIPPRAWNRPAQKSFLLGAPHRLNYEANPPAYSQFDGTGDEVPKGEKLSEVRRAIQNKKFIAKRGGWRRLLLIALIGSLFVVAMLVGLVVGLRNRHKSKNGSGSSTSGGAFTKPTSNSTFPAGSYSIGTYLDTVSTNCTSDSATWSCYPYVTYASSPSQSAATFDWIIEAVEGTPNYTVSSTANYFSIVFSNASMSLTDKGTDQEHYFFQFNAQKSVVPAAALTSSNVASRCFFNQTMFQAYLYTKMEKTYPSNSTTSTNATEAFAPWPFAAKVEQVAGAGAGTPTCLDASGNVLGDFSVSDTIQLCDCVYLNTGT